METEPSIQTPADKPASTQELEALGRSLYRHFNARTLDDAARLIADDCQWINIPSGTAFHGPSGYLAFQTGWITAFPDGQIEICNVVCHGDMVVVEFVGRGTHQGPLTNATGDTLAPTGKRVEIRLVDVLQFRGNKVVRGRTYYDALSMLTQLGVR